MLSFTKSIFTIDNSRINLVSFNDIRNELENKEMESWQKLIRVLTHEIMNSISPITSLTKVVQNHLNQLYNIISQSDVNSKKYIDKTLKGIKTIELTSNSLLHFVEQYRSLTLLPKPTFTNFNTYDLLEDIKTLFDQELLDEQISFTIELASEKTTLYADYNMLKQVITNLINNSIFALKNKENAFIKVINSINAKNHNIIQVIDNGIGIDETLIDKIFIPFFTTKSSGTGIGLSLSKQILRLHSGDIRVKSVPNESTVFSIIL